MLSQEQKRAYFKKLRRDPTSMWYHPDADLLGEGQFIRNLHRYHPRIYMLLMEALNRTEYNLYKSRTDEQNTSRAPAMEP